MARVTVDFSDVEEFEALEPSDYIAEITKVEYRAPEEGSDKYPYLNVEVTIREEPYEGRKVWGIWSMSPKALWRMKQAWENLGIIAEDSEIELDVDEETNLVTEPALVGMPCIVSVKNEMYEGQARSRAEAFRATEDAPKRGAAKPKAGAAKKAAPKRKFA